MSSGVKTCGDCPKNSSDLRKKVRYGGCPKLLSAAIGGVALFLHEGPNAFDPESSASKAGGIYGVFLPWDAKSSTKPQEINQGPPLSLGITDCFSGLLYQICVTTQRYTDTPKQKTSRKL